MKLTDIITIKLDEVRQAPSNLKQFANSDAAEGMMAGFEAEMVFKGWNNDERSSNDPQPNYEENPQTGSINDIIEFFDVREYNSGSEIARLQASLENRWNEWLATESSEYFHNNAERIVRDWIEGDKWDWTEEITKALKGEGYSQEEIDGAYAAQKAIHKARLSYDDDKIAAAREKYKDAFGIYVDGQQLAKDKLEELTDKAIEDGNSDYYAAQKIAREVFEEEDAYQGDWLESEGLDHMRAVADEYSSFITWPLWDHDEEDNEGGFSEEGAERLADSLVKIIPDDQKVRATAWGGKDKDLDTWYIESDSSVTFDNNGDLPCEIVSPPMPLKECLAVMDKFFAWAEKNGGYTNSSTGFHMGVSMPGQEYGTVDFVKLALFLGDKYVLEEFDRVGNQYCASALKKIKAVIEHNDVKPKKALEALRAGLDRKASEVLANNQGFGKFTSINPKQKYIEFRSAGNKDYSKDVAKLQSTLGRYAQAMWIASHPEAYRDEYQKKMYKLLEPSEDKTNTINELVKLSAGKTTDAKIDGWAERMKTILRKSNVDRMAAKGDKILVWKVKQKFGSGSYSDVVAKTAAEAIKICQDHDRDWNRSTASSFIATPIKQASPEQVARYEAKHSGKAEVHQWEVYDKNTGNSVHQFDNPENTIQAGVGYALSWYTALPEDERPAAAGQLGVRPVPQGEGEMWEAYRRDNNQVVHRFHNPGGTAASALAITNAWYDTQPPMNVRVWDLKVRPVPEITQDVRTHIQHEYISDPHGNWIIRRKDENGRPTGPVIFRFRAPNIETASIKALAWARHNNLQNQIRLSHVDDVSVELLSPTDTQEPPRTGGEWTGEWKIVDGLNREVYRFSGVGNSQSDANRVAREWVQSQGFDGNFEVYPVMR